MGPKKTSANSGDDLVQGVPEEPVVPGPNQAPEDLQADVKGLKESYMGHQQLLEVLLQQQARISEQMEQLLLLLIYKLYTRLLLETPKHWMSTF